MPSSTPSGIVGLSLALVAASWVEAFLLLVAFRHRHADFGLVRLARAHAWYLAAAVAAGFVADRAYDVLAGPRPGSRPAGGALALAGAGIVGLAVYVGLAALLRVPELGVTIDLVRSGLARAAH